MNNPYAANKTGSTANEGDGLRFISKALEVHREKRVTERSCQTGGRVNSHRHTGPSSDSTTSPTRSNPHFAKTRVEALASGSVCARTSRTRSLPNAKTTSAVAASVA